MTQPKSSKPTVVFVHGGWADSTGWNTEIAALQHKGYPASTSRPSNSELVTAGDFLSEHPRTTARRVVTEHVS